MAYAGRVMDVEYPAKQAAMTPLAALLAERGMSQGALARRTRLTRKSVTNAYRGRVVSFETWLKIAKALDVKLTALDPDAAERLGAALGRSGALSAQERLTRGRSQAQARPGSSAGQ